MKATLLKPTRIAFLLWTFFALFITNCALSLFSPIHSWLFTKIIIFSFIGLLSMTIIHIVKKKNITRKILFNSAIIGVIMYIVIAIQLIRDINTTKFIHQLEHKFATCAEAKEIFQKDLKNNSLKFFSHGFLSKFWVKSFKNEYHIKIIKLNEPLSEAFECYNHEVASHFKITPVHELTPEEKKSKLHL